ncbi:Siphovirus-type tail component [uncultured Caudovirales phage]|uniref:Siphovirus-type tail component n=1 Tax=uncultured Caudovirales phage TaxID=2100421 RepID=A0A6J7WLP7_9CAUD|nr:Siphovirus-type tail component [uncultured Caudovirales phage]CAB5218677.1 Siphovirus-type tail component [uncultured Caudovirales phage]
MPYTLTYSIQGTTYTLNGYDVVSGLKFNYLGDLGFGMAPLHRITQRGPLQQGDSDVDFRLDPRVLQLPFIFTANTMAEHYVIRDKVLAIFSPSNVIGTLTITRPDGTQRAIATKILGGLSLDVDAKSGYSVKTIVQMRADDPTWYNPTQTTIAGTSAIVGTPTPIPRLYPVTYGASGTINVNTSVTYSGTWNAYPNIVAVGPLNSLIIQNTSTGDIITLTANIAAGTTYIFDLRYGFKTVVDQLGANVLANISATSNLATFNLAPMPQVVGGINNISITATGGTSSSNVTLTYNDRFIGV